MASVLNDSVHTDVAPPSDMKGSLTAPVQLHRIQTVREQQNVSLRTAARHLQTEMAEVRRQDCESNDVTVSELYRWQKILDVPVADLLVDPGSALSGPIRDRAQMIRLMKTAAAILEHAEEANSPPVKRMARTLVDQLIAMMPELSEVGPWHSVGQRRSLDEMGRVAEQTISEGSIRGAFRE